MERFMKEELKVYLIVNEHGVTQNVFPTLGKAIDAISYNAHRIDRNRITKQTYTSLEWIGTDAEEYSLKVMECPLCNDVTLDYMNKPREFSL